MILRHTGRLLALESNAITVKAMTVWRNGGMKTRRAKEELQIGIFRISFREIVNVDITAKGRLRYKYQTASKW